MSKFCLQFQFFLCKVQRKKAIKKASKAKKTSSNDRRKGPPFFEEVEEVYVVKNYYMLQRYYCKKFLTVNSMNGHIYGPFHGLEKKNQKAQI